MLDNKDLINPTGSFIDAVRESVRSRGDKIANEHFDGDMAIVMGEVFGDWLACGIIEVVGNSLWDVPMQ